jgi:hypothetical protein
LPRLFLFTLICAFALSAQQKKILVSGNPAFAHELEGISPGAKIVSVTPGTVMQEISDADAYIGNITSAEVRAGKNLKWVGVMSAGVESVLFPKDGTRSGIPVPSTGSSSTARPRWSSASAESVRKSPSAPTRSA